MSWDEYHSESERLASEAESASRNHNDSRAQALYRQAAEAEYRALAEIARGKRRTLAATVVSVVSLYYKAGELRKAQEIATDWLEKGRLLPFAEDQIKQILETITGKAAAKSAAAKSASARMRDVTHSVIVIGDHNAWEQEPGGRRTRFFLFINQLINQLKKAIRDVPTPMYGLGIASIIGFIAIVVVMGTDLKVAVFGTIAMLFLITVLTIVANLNTPPGNMLKYSALIIINAIAIMLVSSVFIRWPLDLKYLVFPDPPIKPPHEMRIGKLPGNPTSFSVDANYDPSGEMGDIGDIKMSKDAGAVRFTYETLGKGPHKWDWTYVEHQLNPQPAQFAGVAYLDPPNNWGTAPRGGFDLRGYRIIRWEARSLSDEVKVEFVIGGINWIWDALKKERVEPPYPDSLRYQRLGIKTLTPQWQSFEFILASANIPEEEFACVVGAFSWVISWGSNGVKLNATETGPENPKTFVLEVRNIRYER
jgi:hypothetical protein